jgi:hypothetical protein
VGAGVGGESQLAAAGGANAGSGLFGLLLSLMVAEKSGFQLVEQPAESELRSFTEQVTRQAMDAIQQAVVASGPVQDLAANGATPPSATTIATASRLDGLDVRTDGS